MYLGLDLGTSGLKALVTDETGSVLATSHAKCRVSAPQAGWSEQEPSEWVDALKSVLADLSADIRSNIRAISFSGHMHGAVVVDEHGAPLRPCILWNDTRSAEQAAKLDAMPQVRDLSGNIVFPGFTAPKLCWLAENEPETYALIHKVLLPKDYLLYWFTGRFVTDMSDASGSSWLDVGNRTWSDHLLDASNMRRDQMPDLLEGTDVVGPILANRQAELALPKGIKVVAGGADNAVSACGVGVVDEGQGFVSLGTSGVLLAGKGRYAPAPETALHTFCHAIPDQWYQMGVILSATNCLNWLAKVLDTSPQKLSMLCDAPVSGPSKLTFLPYLSGERTPHNDTDVAGAFLGLGLDTTATDMTQAVMEGVCFAMRDCLEALKTTGTTLDEILAIGGGTRSEFWLHTMANVLNLRLAIPKQGDFGAALGAARLAMIGDGHAIKDVLTPPDIARIIHPDPNLVPRYQQKYQTYKRAYPGIKSLMP